MFLSIDTRRLIFFLTVAEELHFRRAAERLHITQPPLSMAIRGLEEDLGVTLMTRTTRSVQLTPAGERLFERGQAIVGELRWLETELKQVAKGQRGRLSVGFVGIAMWMGLPEMIRSFRGDYPDVQLRLDEIPSALLQEKTLAGEVDIGFIRALETPDPRLSHQLVAEEEYWLAMPQGHPLAAFDEVPLDALHEEHLLFFPRRFGPLIYDRWIAVFAEAGIEPVLIQEVRSFHAELSLVVAGVGLCLMTESVTHGSRPGVEYRRLLGPTPKVRVFGVWNPRDKSQTRDCFLEVLDPKN